MGVRTETIKVQQSLPRGRLDSFLHQCFPVASRATIQRLIEEGEIRLNGQTAKCSHHPREGDLIEVHWPEVKPARLQAEPIPLDVLYEDDDLLVLNKTAGLVVHPAAGHSEHTLVHALLHHCAGHLSGIGGEARPGIVHRLDKETSGCLVVAKTDTAHLHLAGQFAQRQVAKIYLGLLCGELPQMAGDIRAAIGRHPSHRKRMAVTQGSGREAWTSYRLLDRLNAATLVEARLHTGRTHQIRVHFQNLGFPLVGDLTYGERQNQRLTALARYTAPRVMLHALRLTFTHPRTLAALAVEAPLPADFRDALEALAISAS
jgi:23S rRNA pseudouridine1911/1915/1917 synthase